jgi:large subunit ribosomal protein L15
MKLHELAPGEGARREKRRVGRGHGSGRVKTSGRGTKGQNSRAGGGVRLGFEGGQNPWTMRIPHKRGFNIGRFRKSVQVLNLRDLEAYFDDGQSVTPAVLSERGIVDNTTDPIKLLGQGTLSKRLTLELHYASGTARAAVEAAGGSLTLLRAPKPVSQPGKSRSPKSTSEEAEPAESQTAETESAPAE